MLGNAPAISTPLVGLQLWTVREEAAADLRAVLDVAAGAGYDGVEFAGYHNHSPAEISEMLRNSGQRAAGTTAGLADFEGDWERVLDDASAIGSPFIAFPWMEEKLRTRHGFEHLADLLSMRAPGAAARGIRLLYHVHGYEFSDLGGSTGIQILEQRCAQDVVAIQPDTYWVASAGIDPLAFLTERCGHCPSIHLKDASDRQSMEDTEAGSGTLGIPAIVGKAVECGTEWLIVEQEKFSIAPFESIAISQRNIRGMLAGSWGNA